MHFNHPFIVAFELLLYEVMYGYIQSTIVFTTHDGGFVYI